MHRNNIAGLQACAKKLLSLSLRTHSAQTSSYIMGEEEEEEHLFYAKVSNPIARCSAVLIDSPSSV